MKHKADVSRSPGAAREGLQAPAPPSCLGTHEDPRGAGEAPAAAMAGQNHQERLRGCGVAQRSRLAD